MSLPRAIAAPVLRSCRPLRRSIIFPPSPPTRNARCNTTSGPAIRASPARRRHVGPFIWYGSLLALGLGLGYQIRVLVFPAPLHIPGSEEDIAALRNLAKVIDGFDIVRALRGEGYHLHSDTPLSDTGKGKEGWRELQIRTLVSDDPLKEHEISRTLTQSTMAGSRGLGVQRAFWNPVTNELVAVVWCGGAITGWPGLTHGGAIATLFEEAFTRVAAGPDKSLDSKPASSSLSLTYARPTQAHSFYVLRASFSAPEIPQEAPPKEPQPAKSWLPSWKDFTKKAHPPLGQSTVEVSGTLETLDGKLSGAVMPPGRLMIPSDTKLFLIDVSL